MSEQQRCIEEAKREFTGPELLALKDELARKTREKFDQQATRKEVVSRLDAEIKVTNDEIFTLSDQIDKGYEYVDVEMIILMDQPRPGQKTLVRTDTGKDHRVDPMTAEDKQGSFFEGPIREE